LIKLVRYHPAPPERLFRGQLNGNEQISNQIYRMTEQMGGMLRDIYHTSTVRALTSQVQDLQASLFSARVSLDDAVRAVRERGRERLVIPPPAQTTNRILQLNALKLTGLRCQSDISDQWIEVDATDEDPQLHLPPLQGGGGKVQLRLSWISEAHSALQVYWAIGDDGFSAEQVHTVQPADGMQTTNVLFDVPEGERMVVRIDPTTGIGKSRLRGSLAGLFTLLAIDLDGTTAELDASDLIRPISDNAAKTQARIVHAHLDPQPQRTGRRGRSKAGA
jgi:hypothetical protein